MVDLGDGGGIVVQVDGPYGGGSTGKITEILLSAENWKGADDLFSMIVTVDGVSQRSKVDLWPSKELMESLNDMGTGLCAENADGVVTVYAIGNKPDIDITIQATLTEVTS